ncbi:MAG: hypothetical protein PHI59_09815 [Candidatus Omnitrophica bacterium]|nr:hypothetical protein [Candidatus Omnitrophota bacterium]
MAIMHISKLDAAKRQLDTAITLFYQKADPVSIHTLTCAAYEILYGFAKSRRMIKTLKNNMFIKEEYRKKLYGLLNEPQNFFKHWQGDCKKQLKFNSAITKYFLLDAIEIYMMITGENPREMTGYRTLFLFNNPLFITGKNRKMLSEISAHDLFSEPKFLGKYLDILYRMKDLDLQIAPDSIEEIGGMSKRNTPLEGSVPK